MIGAKLGAGREADVSAWGDGAVVKLYRPGFGGHRAEATASRSLAGLRVAPELLDVVDCDSRTGLVLERLGGSDMLTLLHREPRRPQVRESSILSGATHSDAPLPGRPRRARRTVAQPPRSPPSAA